MIDIARTALALKEQCADIDCDECPLWCEKGYCILTLEEELIPADWRLAEVNTVVKILRKSIKRKESRYGQIGTVKEIHRLGYIVKFTDGEEILYEAHELEVVK